MPRQNELQIPGQEQSFSQAHCTSEASSIQQCIPIKRRWLDKFDTAERSTSRDIQDKIGFPVDSDSPQEYFSNLNHEALDLTKHSRLPASQGPPKPLKESVTTTTTVLKRASNTSRSLVEQSFKRSRPATFSLHNQELRGTSYQLPSSVSSRHSFGKLLHEPHHSDAGRYREGTGSHRHTSKLDRQDQWGSARQQQDRSKTILEQCLSGVLDSFPVSPTVEDVLQYQDHTKLSIGHRTELDKLHDKELVEKYLEITCGKRSYEMPHSRLRSMISAMFCDQDSYRDEFNGQGLSRFSNTDRFGHSYSANPTSGHQPFRSQSGTYQDSTMPQDLVRGGGDLSTISIGDLFVPTVTPRGNISEHHDSLHTAGRSNSFQQIGNGSVLNGETLQRNVELPKVEKSDHLPSCQSPTAHFPGTSTLLSVDNGEHPIERVERVEHAAAVKSEADTCSLAENEPVSSNSALARTVPNPQVTAAKPADGKCPICTDVISGYHYGTHSCESCKGFFKRTIQNKRNERLACALEGRCVINLQNRKHCAFCRFKKCLDSGMKQEAVREDRQRGGRSMYDGSSEQRRRQHLQIQQQQKESLGQVKKRKPRKRAPSTATQPPKEVEDAADTARMLPQSSSLSATLSNPSKPSTSTANHSTDSSAEFDAYGKKLEVLEATFFNPFGLPRISIDRSDIEKSLLNGAYYLLDHFCKKLPAWIELMPLLHDLEVSDRSALLKANWLQVLVLTVCYRCHDNNGHLFLPDRSSCDMVAVVNSVAILDIVRRLKQLAQTFQTLKTTRTEYHYLKLLILLNPDVKNLSQPSRVSGYQEKVQEQLFELGIAKEGISASMKIGELLLKLSELERLSHLIKEHLVFTQVAGQFGSRKYSNLENMLEES